MKGTKWLALLAAAILSACAQSTPPLHATIAPYSDLVKAVAGKSTN